MNMDISAENLTLQYRDTLALEQVSFHLKGPKIYGVLGRNGAGKTSLLSILASFRAQTAGELKIAGEEVFENPNVMQRVIFISDQDYKEETDSVKKLVQWAGRYRPFFDLDYANTLLQKFKLPLNKKVKDLSKGMQAALSVTIGLACRAPITIFDEAYVGMDAPTREIFYRELLADQEIHPRMILMSTHLVTEMDYLFEEVLILRKGVVILQEDCETMIGKGATITGSAQIVDDFVQGMKVLNTQSLGAVKSVTVYGNFGNAKRKDAQVKGLEVGSISLQDLFIHLTEEE